MPRPRNSKASATTTTTKPKPRNGQRVNGKNGPARPTNARSGQARFSNGKNGQGTKKNGAAMAKRPRAKRKQDDGAMVALLVGGLAVVGIGAYFLTRRQQGNAARVAPGLFQGTPAVPARRSVPALGPGVGTYNVAPRVERSWSTAFPAAIVPQVQNSTGTRTCLNPNSGERLTYSVR